MPYSIRLIIIKYCNKAEDRTPKVHFMDANIMFSNPKNTKPPLRYVKRALYPAPESNRHGFPQVFETSASTNSASWAYRKQC
jgi:hypothetical protein